MVTQAANRAKSRGLSPSQNGWNTVVNCLVSLDGSASVYPAAGPPRVRVERPWLVQPGWARISLPKKKAVEEKNAGSVNCARVLATCAALSSRQPTRLLPPPP